MVSDPWHGLWSANAELAAMDVTQVRVIRAFFAKLKGQINTFHLPAVETAQHSGSNPTASGAASQGAVTINLSNSGLGLKAGMMVTIALTNGDKQLVMLTGDQAGAAITFEPPIRGGMSSGAAIETITPYAQVALTSPLVAWTAELGPIYSLSFSAEEVF